MRPSSLHRALTATGLLVVVVLFVGPIGIWPWDHDEVHSLIELGRLPVDSYPGPKGQMERMHLLLPMWWLLQNAALTVLPLNEWGTRLLPSIAGALTVAIGFMAGLRARGRWFGWSLLIIMGGSQTLLWLSQVNRFYSFVTLWSVLAVLCIWNPDIRRRFDVLAIFCAGAAALSHGLSVVVFGLGGLAAILLWAAGQLPAIAARRAILASAASAGVYLVYLRPLLSGWQVGGTGGTPPLISFVAQLGIAPLALAVVGIARAIRAPREAFLSWSAVTTVLSVLFLAAVPWLLSSWNPRYALLFMPPFWMLAAEGAATIANAITSPRLATAWLMAVLLWQMPKLASHFVDGSRHDFRTAARLVADRGSTTRVLSNWPAELQYYLGTTGRERTQYWEPGQPLPDEESVIVLGSNAWEPVLRARDRHVTVLGEIGRRRFDEQSHVIRVYLVSPAQR